MKTIRDYEERFMREDTDEQFVGLTLEEADELAGKQDPPVCIRVTNRNGVPRIVTRDYHTDRINVYVVEGIITRVGGRG